MPPGPGNVILLIEVADTSRLFDREEKLPLYAHAGIPEVWLIDLVHEHVTVYTEPMEGSYRWEQQFARGTTISSTGLQMLRLPVDSILG